LGAGEASWSFPVASRVATLEHYSRSVPTRNQRPLIRGCCLERHAGVEIDVRVKLLLDEVLIVERDAIDLYTRRHALAPSVLDDYAVNLAVFQLAAGHFGLVFL
jgi:hypothetical protein